MPVYLDPTTGVLRRERTSPGTPWREVEGTGTLFRTRRSSGEWVAERGHFTRWEEYEQNGWERVASWRSLPLPSTWHLGSRSGIRFGFADLAPHDPGANEDIPMVAVVLPGEPAYLSTACCPGSRSVMQVGMLTNGVPADYLVEKLLTARLRKIGLNLQDFQWNLRVERKPTDWEQTRLEELHMLAERLSDDLMEAARAAFGAGQPTSAWNRKRQVAAIVREVGPSVN